MQRCNSFFGVIFALWAMLRPLIMLSVILVFAAGLVIALADGASFVLARVVWGGAGLLLVIASTHYVNEYADYETDALTQRTLYSGGSGALPSGYAPRWVALAAGRVTLGLGVIVVVLAVVQGGLPVSLLVILLLGAGGGWMYSMPPLKLAWRGWGELDNAVLGGILLPLYGYVTLMGEVRLSVVIGCIPFALLVFNNLLATTWADREADAIAGKYTLATRWPPRRLRGLYLVVALLAFGLLVLLVGDTLPSIVALLSLVAVPLVGWGGLVYTRRFTPAPSFAMMIFLLAQMLGWYANSIAI